MRYQPQLDGIRALAVLAVMLYHGGAGFAGGGFLGVDVFFVLSGYLITGLLLAERSRFGDIDLLRFWGRRARRLLPALFLVLLAVAAYAALAVGSEELPGLRLDALSTLAYVANWRFAFGHVSYFAQYQAPSPLRHMWSLGIEEQFYLLFPLFLTGWLRLSRGGTRLLRAAMAAAAVGSALLMLALYDPLIDPSRVYYGTDTRAQALLVGALLGAWTHAHPPRPRPAVYLGGGRLALPLPGWGAIGLAGLACLAAIMATVGDLTPWLYRGGYLLTAVASGAVVVGSTRRPRSLVARLLSVPPLRVIGVISYGLYLWHWPIYVAVTPERTGLHGWALLGPRMVLTFAAATLSYRLVEAPIRRGQALRWLRPERLVAATTATACVVAGAVVLATIGGGTAAAPAATAVAPPRPGAVRVLFVGDSVAYNLSMEFPGVDHGGLDVSGSTALGCGLLADPLVVGDQTEPMLPACSGYDEQWRRAAAGYRPAVAVLMLGVGEQFDRRVDGRMLRFGTAAYERFLDQALADRARILGEGGRPVVLLTVPCHQVLESAVVDDGRIINDERRVDWLNDVQRRFAAEHPKQVRLLDLHGYLCADGYTNTRDGVKLRKEGLHFTEAGVALIWRWLAPQLSRIAAATGAP